MFKYHQQATNGYHSSPFYAKNSEFEAWQFKIIYSLLNMNSNTRNSILDLGGGTGRLAQLLIEKLGAKTEIVCVDISPSMLEQAKNLSRVTPVCSDVEKYISLGTEKTFDGVILKEMIHHINMHNLDEFFIQIKRLLKPQGTCLICTRPQQGIEYPFFAHAIERWHECQPDVNLYVEALHKAEFKQIQITEESYPLCITVDDWVNFIRNRIWSNFSHAHYTDADLDKGIEEILVKNSRSKIIEFNEKQIFIKALNL